MLGFQGHSSRDIASFPLRLALFFERDLLPFTTLDVPTASAH